MTCGTARILTVSKDVPRGGGLRGSIPSAVI